MEKEKKIDENYSQKKCYACGKIMEKGWNYCPFCKRNIQKPKSTHDRFQEENAWLMQLLKKE